MKLNIPDIPENILNIIKMNNNLALILQGQNKLE
jgi:hypothetical protein